MSVTKGGKVLEQERLLQPLLKTLRELTGVVLLFYSDNWSKIGQIETPWHQFIGVFGKGRHSVRTKKNCSLSWEPLREFTGGVLLLFPQVLFQWSTLVSIQRNKRIG